MSVRKAVAVRRADFMGAVMGGAPSLSRAGALVESGQLDRACDIAQLAHNLTDAALRAMERESAERGRRAARAIPAIRSLRSAAFEAVAGVIIDRLEQRRR